MQLVKYSTYLPEEIIEMLRREAYWTGMTPAKLLQNILIKRYSSPNVVPSKYSTPIPMLPGEKQDDLGKKDINYDTFRTQIKKGSKSAD